MNNILVFGASSSKNSINRELAKFVGLKLKNVELNILDLNDFEMPIYSVDIESIIGKHQLALSFKSHIDQADAIIISFAEHNGNVSAAYKNIYDWVSRIDKNVWQDKPLFLAATSPGARGGKGVLEIVKQLYGYRNKKLVTFSLPSFYDNFQKNKIVDLKIYHEFEQKLKEFQNFLNN